ncbi:MAG TPA: branched-chain amino acid ABC transporter permease [Chloroflexia bacterium]|nr:branched-chain amino acid ABC transporter permease [Chloroflexia bacterium]
MPEPIVLLQQLINGISRGSVYALIALGYTMVYGIIELINFAHGEVFMLGTFTAMSFVTVFGINDQNPILSDPVGLILVLILTFLVTMISMGVLGVLIERAAYRPLRNAPRLAPLISAIGVSYILQNIGQVWKGPASLSFPRIMQDQLFRIPMGDRFLIIRSQAIVVLLVSIGFTVLLTLFVARTKLGKAMRATAQDQTTSQLMGINVNRTISLTFFIGAALAGAGAVLYGMFIQGTQFTLGNIVGLKAFTAAVLGGIGNIPGAVLGGYLIGVIESASDAFGGLSRWTNAIVFAVLILILVFRPSGLLGQQVPEKV